ncbi:MAG: hypothetical protein OYH77_07405 [Pseudomonadota bacterium]|nr:hypothetical protein [Pseudomonadota bacterium]
MSIKLTEALIQELTKDTQILLDEVERDWGLIDGAVHMCKQEVLRLENAAAKPYKEAANSPEKAVAVLVLATAVQACKSKLKNANKDTITKAANIVTNALLPDIRRELKQPISMKGTKMLNKTPIVENRIKEAVEGFKISSGGQHQASMINGIILTAEQLLHQIPDKMPSRLIKLKIKALTIYKALIERLIPNNEMRLKALESNAPIPFTEKEMLECFADINELIILVAESRGWQDNSDVYDSE